MKLWMSFELVSLGKAGLSSARVGTQGLLLRITGQCDAVGISAIAPIGHRAGRREHEGQACQQRNHYCAQMAGCCVLGVEVKRAVCNLKDSTV